MTLLDGSKTLRIFQLLHWIADPLGYMESNAAKYGDIFLGQISPNAAKVVLVSNPEALQTILSNPKQFPAPGHLNELFKSLLGASSVIMLDNPQHQKQRKLLLPPFHGERMQAYSQLICDLTKEVTSQWQVGTPFSVRNTMQKITMRVILQAVFGLHKGERYAELEELLSKRLNATSSPLNASLIFFPFLAKDYGFWSPGRRLKIQQNRIDELLYAEIRDRRSQGESDRADILSLLLSARDENGQGMTDEELRDELMTLLVAGHETTATALTWALYWTHQIPEVQQKLLAEIDSLGENPDPMSLFKLPYLTAVCQETLRIYPVGMLTFPRLAKESEEVTGKYLEAGSVILGSIYLLHQRVDLYPEPKKFKPERFLERQFSPYEYMPFGAGARRCIGATLAEFELKLVLATILRQYQLELADSRPVKPQRRGLTLGPAGGVKMVLTGQRISTPKPLVTV